MACELALKLLACLAIFLRFAPVAARRHFRVSLCNGAIALVLARNPPFFNAIALASRGKKGSGAAA